jgi:hypothetical protein
MVYQCNPSEPPNVETKLSAELRDLRPGRRKLCAAQINHDGINDIPLKTGNPVGNHPRTTSAPQSIRGLISLCVNSFRNWGDARAME